jgi:hypothetical protein
MYCVSGSIVWYTEPFALGRVKLNSAFWQFPSPVTLLESVESGLFIAADKTYFYRFKNPDDVQVEELFEYGAISNTAVRMPHDDGIMWQSTRGAIMGTEDGKAKNVQEPLVATGDAASGAALLRELDGLRQFISVLSDAQTNALTASDFMEAEVIRKGA